MAIITKTVRTVKTVRTKTVKTVKTVRTTGGAALLTFGKGNAKLIGVYTFSLPAGYSCPGARQCLARAVETDGKVKVQDGKHAAFRCFSASQEAQYPSVRAARWRNYDALKGLTAGEMAELILASLPAKAKAVRIHVSGDFFSQAYMDAWILVARARPGVLFYAYTKSLPFWLARIEELGTGHVAGTVPNFVLTASRGGKHDRLIDAHGLRSAVVVHSQAEADRAGLSIDDDDSHAMAHGDSFALLIHGAQPAGSAAAKAIAGLRAQGEFGYGAKADARRLALPTVN